MIAVRKLGARLALVTVLGLVAVGCKSVVFTPDGNGAGTGSCYPGTWKLDAQSLNSSLPSNIPGLDVTASGDGITLNLTDTTWTLHADQKLTASLHTDYGDASGEVTVVGDANGAYSVSGSTADFSLKGISGTVSYHVTIFGMDFSKTINLPGSGLDQRYALQGSATASCTANSLTLEFHGLKMHAHK
jgi:hypothetical protein